MTWDGRGSSEWGFRHPKGTRGSGFRKSISPPLCRASADSARRSARTTRPSGSRSWASMYSSATPALLAGNRSKLPARRCGSSAASSPRAARAAIPAVPGLADVGCLTNETVFSFTELPAAADRHRRRTHRLRAGAGLPPLRQRRHARATGRAPVAQGRARRGGDPGPAIRPRGHQAAA